MANLLELQAHSVSRSNVPFFRERSRCLVRSPRWFEMVNGKVEPAPGCDSHQIRPPWRRTKILTYARRMPSPGTVWLPER